MGWVGLHHADFSSTSAARPPDFSFRTLLFSSFVRRKQAVSRRSSRARERGGEREQQRGRQSLRHTLLFATHTHTPGANGRRRLTQQQQQPQALLPAPTPPPSWTMAHQSNGNEAGSLTEEADSLVGRTVRKEFAFGVIEGKVAYRHRPDGDALLYRVVRWSGALAWMMWVLGAAICAHVVRFLGALSLAGVAGTC